ncbi:MAG: hypothetical protein MZU97_14060 [Bacillus subtilis]|nr:hypothetical protein [Bacillus subtilis]
MSAETRSDSLTSFAILGAGAEFDATDRFDDDAVAFFHVEAGAVEVVFLSHAGEFDRYDLILHLKTSFQAGEQAIESEPAVDVETESGLERQRSAPVPFWIVF